MIRCICCGAKNNNLNKEAYRVYKARQRKYHIYTIEDNKICEDIILCDSCYLKIDRFLDGGEIYKNELERENK